MIDMWRATEEKTHTQKTDTASNVVSALECFGNIQYFLATELK